MVEFLRMTIPFSTSHVPILGQKITVDGYTIAVSARCQCEDKGAFVSMTVTCSSAGTAIVPGACPKCGLGYTIHGMEMDKAARLTFNIAVLSATPPIQQ